MAESGLLSPLVAPFSSLRRSRGTQARVLAVTFALPTAGRSMDGPEEPAIHIPPGGESGYNNMDMNMSVTMSMTKCRMIAMIVATMNLIAAYTSRAGGRSARAVPLVQKLAAEVSMA